MHGVAGTQRHDVVFTEREFLVEHPGLPDQCDVLRIARHSVEIRAVMAGKGFQLVESTKLFEYLCVEFERCHRSEA